MPEAMQLLLSITKSYEYEKGNILCTSKKLC